MSSPGDYATPQRRFLSQPLQVLPKSALLEFGCNYAGSAELAYLREGAEGREVHGTGDLETKLAHTAARQGGNADDVVQDV